LLVWYIYLNCDFSLLSQAADEVIKKKCPDNFDANSWPPVQGTLTIFQQTIKVSHSALFHGEIELTTCRAMKTRYY